MSLPGLGQPDSFESTSDLTGRHAEGFLNAVVGAIPDIVLVVDAAGRYRLVSEAHERLVGRPAREIIGRTAADLFTLEFGAFALATIDQTLRGNSSLSFEHPIRMGRSERWFRSTTSPFEFEGETCVVWIAREITDEKFTARALEIVNSITREISHASCVLDALHAALDRICEGLGWPVGEAWLADRKGESLSRTTFRVFPDAEPLQRLAESRREVTQQKGVGLTGRAWQTGQLHYSADLANDPLVSPSAGRHLSSHGIHGACAIPLLSQERVLGVLTFLLDDPTDEEPRLVAALAGAMIPLGALLHRLDTEKELQSLVARLDLTLSGGNIGVWEWNAARNEMVFDEQMLRIYQLPESRRVMTMDEWFRFVDDEAAAARLLGVLDNQISGVSDFVDETVAIKDAGGVPKNLIIRARVLRLPTGAIDRIVGVNIDVTEDEKTRSELKKYARFHEESPGPIFRINIDGAFVDTNASASRMLEALGHKVGEIRPQWIRLALRCLSDRKKRSEKFTGGGQTFQLDFVPVVEHDYVNIYGTDVSREQEVEHQLHEAHKLEMMGRVTGGVAHHFNNRLTAIIGNLQLLQRKCADDDTHLRIIGTALKSARAGADLVQRLMKMSMQDFMKAEVIDLNALIESTLQSESALIPGYVHLVRSYWAEACYVRIDPRMFAESLVVLIENAVQAMPEGGRLAIATAIVDVDPAFARSHDLTTTDCVRISVEDSGTGIDKATIKNIFEPFFTTREPGQGVGLGLCVVHGMVERLHGAIEVKSQRGAGSCFNLYLPHYRGGRP